MSRSSLPAAFLLLAAVFFCACDGGGENVASEATGPDVLATEGTWEPDQLPSRWGQGQARDEVGEVAAQLLAALERRDIGKVASLIHSGRGLRLSPYAFVAPDEHVRLSAVELVEAWNDPAPRVWGYDDATGEPIELTLREYLDQFIYDGEFSAAESVGYNTRIGQGNTVDNAAEIYPDGVTVEYHLPGTPDYGGMDWKSLRLVLARDPGQDGAWRLVAIIHDQWTP